MKKKLRTLAYVAIFIVYSTLGSAHNIPTDSTNTVVSTITNDTSLTHTSIANTLNEWHKTRYQMGGNTKRGIDCSHFTAVVYKNTYGKIVTGSARDYYANIDTTFTSPLELKTGDMVFFNINGRSLSHVGVYVGNNEFVHATVHAGVIKSNLNEPYYTRYYKGAGRFKNLTPQLYVTDENITDVSEKLISTKVSTTKKSKKTTKKKTVAKKKKVTKKKRKR